MKTVYVDNNATTRTAPEVIDEMLPFLGEHYGNPSSAHRLGKNVAAKIDEAREKVAALIHASPEEIIFTSCGTESDNAAIRAAIESNPGKKHIIASRVEHPAVKNPCEHMAENGRRLTLVPVDEKGRLDMDCLMDSLSDDTALVSVMWANNESGVVFPIEEIAMAVREKGILFHTDAVQAGGKIPIDVSATGVDMLSLSGHKMHAPKGVGALYVRKGVHFSPFLKGGGQEKGRRGGTENTASIIGFGKACELAAHHLQNGMERVRHLRDKLETGLIYRIPQSYINGDEKNRLPNTSNIAFDHVEGGAALLMMNELGICASSGSACDSGSIEPSPVLRAMGVPFTAARGSIRFSLSMYNTEEEIDFILETLPPIIAKLRGASPFRDGA
jgi:cysteine desulfurase